MDAIVETLGRWTGLEMSIHGWIALALGAIFVTAFQVGYMWLAVRSNRSGHDASVKDYEDPRDDVRRRR